jgi:hypothetical protein
MSARVEFTGKALAGELRVTRREGGRWSLTIFKFIGKYRDYQSLAHISGDLHQRPHLDLGDTQEGPVLWLGGSCVDVPSRLAPKLQAFLAEHANGGAA